MRSMGRSDLDQLQDEVPNLEEESPLPRLTLLPLAILHYCVKL